MELLQQYLALTTDEERATFLAGLSADDLAAFMDAARAEFDGIEGTGDDDLARMQDLAGAIEAANTENTGREQAEAERAEQARLLRERVAGIATAEGDEGDGTGDEPGDDGTDDDDATGDETGEDADAEGRVPVSAGGTPRQPSIRAAARRVPDTRQPRPQARQQAPLVAAAGIPGFGAGDQLDDPSDIASAFLARFDAVRNARSAGGEPIIVASANVHVERSHQFLGNDSARNGAIVAAVMDAWRTGNEARLPELLPLVAAGGVCDIGPLRYDQDVMGTTDRPIRDQAMARLGADRGSVRWLANPRLADVSTPTGNDAAVGVWTQANDLAALDNDGTPETDVVKPCARFDCPDELSALTEAIVRCLIFGNFMDRTFRERVQAFLTLANVWFARYAEQRLLATMSTGSTAVTFTGPLGATADLLTSLDRHVAGQASFERLGNDTRFTFLAPAWLPTYLREDLARQMPHGTLDERLAIADARIQSFFTTRRIDPVWSPDMQVFTQQGAGAQRTWPATVVGYVYPRGTWAFLDGGTLDLGIQRDSALNKVNDFQMFMETFEGAAKIGNDSHKFTWTLCPNGTASALTAYDCA